MRTLSETAQADIVKLTGGKPWCEVIDITLPEDFSPSATELTFLSKDPDDIYHILITNSIMESRLAIAATGWATQGLTAGYKWYFGVPYQRDPIEDSSEKKGAVNSRIMLGDTGGTIKAIVDKADGFIGLNVSIGFAMVNTASAFTVSTGFLECYEPDVTYDWQIKTTTHDKTYFSCTLFIDSPIEWKFPPRTMFKNVCHFAFKGTECGFDGNVVRPVKPKRGADIIGKSIYPGGWLISGGYVEKLDLAGSVLTTSVSALTDGDYEFITNASGNQFYAKRAGSDYAVYYLDGDVYSVKGSAYYKLINTTEYPIENTLTSGATGDAYAITYTASTRRLYRFSSGTTVTRVGTEQYYNVVSSPSEGVAFAIQGGTYSGGTFTPSNQTTGRLVRIAGVTQTSISEDIAWKWVRAVSATVAYAIDLSDNLYYISGSSVTAVTVYDLENPGVGVTVIGTRNRHNFLSVSVDSEGECYFISYEGTDGNGVLKFVWNAYQYYIDETKVFNMISLVERDLLLIWHSEGIIIGWYHPSDGQIYFDTIDNPKGTVTDILPSSDFHIGSPKFYYVSGGNLYLYEYKPYATCNHRLSDCLLRGNQERFGGYPGIGSGGLTK
jgi:phage-related protein